MSALSERVADDHWFTTHNGWHCVGCGFNDIGRTEDYGAAGRRHLAAVTEKAVRDAILAELADAQSSVFYPTHSHPEAPNGAGFTAGVTEGIDFAARIVREGTTPA